ncbi:MAG TPA: lamin tail domain-containing protein [Candidatus Paceibacterota bacterium]|nr:lamin tail domain-containing protein [Candidatus Paceibacterota bacterium]HRZ29856.1 lamin tail domain-containing protein [Candidatus Paceibacterota bacterium]
MPTTTTTTIPVEMGELKKIVFSEIKIDGENADDEFIELYNPLSEEIDLTG